MTHQPKTRTQPSLLLCVCVCAQGRKVWGVRTLRAARASARPSRPPSALTWPCLILPNDLTQSRQYSMCVSVWVSECVRCCPVAWCAACIWLCLCVWAAIGFAAVRPERERERGGESGNIAGVCWMRYFLRFSHSVSEAHNQS